MAQVLKIDKNLEQLKMNEIPNIFNNPQLDLKKLQALEAVSDPECRYIIAITPRSGSSYLSDVMTHTKNLGKPGEFFNQSIVPSVLKNIPGRTPDEYLRNTMRFRKTSNSVSGLKTSWFQFKNFKECMHDQGYLSGFKYIYLIRRDLDAQAVSLYRATTSSVFHTNIKHSEEAISKLNALEYDFEEIKKWRDHITEQEKGWQRYFYENGIFPLYISYEDIEEDILGVLKRIASFLSIDPNVIDLPEKSSIFEKVGDTRNIEWTHRFALEYALQDQRRINDTKPIAISDEKNSPFDTEYGSQEMGGEVKSLFSCHGYPKASLPKIPVISALPRHSMVIKDSFISAAIFNSDKTLIGAIYENNTLVTKATYRGLAVYKQKDPLTIQGDRIKGAQRITGQCVYLGWLSSYIEHLLVEAPARFWFLEHIDVQNTTFIFHPLGTHTTLSNVFEIELGQELFECFGIKKEQIVLADRDIIVDELVVPSTMFVLNLVADHCQHLIYERLKHHLLQKYDASFSSLDQRQPFTQKKLYLSRRKLGETFKKAVNEEMIEDIFHNHGFEIIFPEQLPFHEQVKLISEASIIAGCGSSALHMAVFLSAKSKTIFLSEHSVSSSQLMISALGDIETNFVCVKGISDNNGEVINYLEETLDQLLAKDIK